MDSFLNAALGAAAGSSFFQFAAFLMIGAAVGWLMVRPRRLHECSASLPMIGVCGAWLGAEMACLIGQAQRGGGGMFLAALIGALGLAWFWRRHHPEPDNGGHIASGRLRA